jgi:hypothetical protein
MTELTYTKWLRNLVANHEDDLLSHICWLKQDLKEATVRIGKPTCTAHLNELDSIERELEIAELNLKRCRAWLADPKAGIILDVEQDQE